MDRPFLSIVIPAYNEEKRILPSLERIAAYLGQQAYTTEVLVVDDGSRDDTCACVQQFGAAHPALALTVLCNPHRGKGYAVKTGMLAARGEHRFLCDADLAMPIDELAKFLPPEQVISDIAIGSREAFGARRYDEPFHRHLMGRVFNLLVQLVAVRGFQDTQCGFKCFRGAVAEDIFPLQRMDGFGFDVEVLFLALKRGYRVTEVPIHWYHVPSSRVDPLRDTMRMIRDALGVRWNDLRGRYRWRAKPAPQTSE